MGRTKQINPSSFKAKESLQTMKDSDGTLWIETRPGNWETYVVWEERMNVIRDDLEKSFRNIKRKELQSLAKSRGISGDQKSEKLIKLLLEYNIPSLKEDSL